jgi:hypothetical protein
VKSLFVRQGRACLCVRRRGSKAARQQGSKTAKQEGGQAEGRKKTRTNSLLSLTAYIYCLYSQIYRGENRKKKQYFTYCKATA